MKLALVHDDLIQRGGAELLLMAMHEVFPDAPIYTSVASEYWLDYCKKKNIDLRLSFFQKWPFAVKLNRYYSPFLVHALAFESFDFSQYDVVISSSSRYAHGIITRPSTLHISYMNSPGRMFWESDDYFKTEDYGWLTPIKALARPFLALPLFHLRQWDYTSAKKIDKIIANSKTPQARIKKYYGRDADIIYPFVEYDLFNSETTKVNSESENQKVVSVAQSSENFNSNISSDEKYFLVVTRATAWKRIDIAIQACKRLGLNLKIIAAGSDLTRLQTIANDSTSPSKSKIEFLGRAPDSVKINLLKNCLALINTQAEDFGIVPLEAMASGKPVIAYGKGGALETVIPGYTGEFFPEQTVESLIQVLQKFEPNKYKPELCRKQAKKFDKIEFANQIKDYVLQHR